MGLPNNKPNERDDAEKETENRKWVHKWSQRDHNQPGSLNLGQKPKKGPHKHQIRGRRQRHVYIIYVNIFMPVCVCVFVCINELNESSLDEHCSRA